MRTIYKYPIEITDSQKIEMPVGSELIHAGFDPTGTPCVWALVDTATDKCLQEILIFGTGNPISEGHYLSSEHIGSFVQGQFVWHVFAGRASAI